MIPEDILSHVVREQTRIAAREEWTSAQRDSQEPLFDYRYDHVCQVVELAKRIGMSLEADMEIIILSAWLHDIAKPGLGGVKDHGIESAKIARTIMQSYGIRHETIEKVTDVIVKHVGLTLESPLEPLEAQVVWEADKLTKLGVTGFVHYIINGIRMRPGMLLDAIARTIKDFLPLAEDIARSMHTEPARKMADERLNNLRAMSAMFEYEKPNE